MKAVNERERQKLLGNESVNEIERQKVQGYEGN